MPLGGDPMQDVTLDYDRFHPASEGLREALTSTGNGYFCTRGAAEWEDAGSGHYPGTYVHGGFNRETTIMGGRPVHNEDLVNLPNWLVLKLRIEGEDAIRLDTVELLGYRHALRRAACVGRRKLRFRDRAGRETTLRSRRFVSMADSHLAAIEWTITPAELVGSRRDRLRARRAGHQSDGRPLPRAGGPPPQSRLASHLRTRRRSRSRCRPGNRTSTSPRRRGPGCSAPAIRGLRR